MPADYQWQTKCRRPARGSFRWDVRMHPPLPYAFPRKFRIFFIYQNGVFCDTFWGNFVFEAAAKTELVQSKFAGEYTSVTYSPMDDDDDDEVTEEIQRRSDLDEACVVGLACHQRTGWAAGRTDSTAELTWTGQLPSWHTRHRQSRWTTQSLSPGAETVPLSLCQQCMVHRQVGTLAIDTSGTAMRRLGGAAAAQTPPRCTKCNSPPINGQSPYWCIMVRCSALLSWPSRVKERRYPHYLDDIVLVSINVVALRLARLVPRSVTVLGRVNHLRVLYNQPSSSTQPGAMNIVPAKAGE